MKFGQTSFIPQYITFDELDVGGVVYHAYHLKICDRARNQCFAEVGWGMDRQMAGGQGFTVFSADQRFLRPLRMEHVLVASRLVAYSQRSITVQHGIYGPGFEQSADLEQVPLDKLPDCRFFAQVKLVFIANTGGPGFVMPDDMRQAFGIA